MINIIKQEIEVDIELKKRIDFICEFCNTTLSQFCAGSNLRIAHQIISIWWSD